MADLKELWNTAKERHGTDELIGRETVREAIRKRSGGLMGKLKNRLLHKIYYSAGSLILLIAAMFLTSNSGALIMLGIVNLAIFIGIILFYREYQSLRTDLDLTEDPLHVMTSFRDRLKRVIKYEELVGLTLYPLSAPAGFLLGMELAGANKPLMDSSTDWIAMIISIVVLTPAGHWLARWMNKKAFGKLLDQLSENIREWEDLS